MIIVTVESTRNGFVSVLRAKWMRNGPANDARVPVAVHCTSREIVTAHMNAFRRAGLIRFSRQYIWLSPEFTTPKEVASCHA